MDPGPLAKLLEKWGQDAIRSLKHIATQSAIHLKTKINSKLADFETKMFTNYGVGVPEKQYQTSILTVTKRIYDDLFGNIDMTLFEGDCQESHPDEQYNTPANASDARRECVNTCIEKVAEHYRYQIEYLFKMQQLSVHPKLTPDELKLPTDFDRMIFIIDLMCSPDPISYELGTIDVEFLRGYKTAKCGKQIQRVATVEHNKKGNPKKSKYSALKAVGKPIIGKFDLDTMEKVVSHSPALSATWRSDTKKYFKKQPFRDLTAIPEELATDLASGKFKMSGYVRSQLSRSAKRAIQTAKKKSASAASAKAKGTLHKFGFTRKEGRK